MAAIKPKRLAAPAQASWTSGRLRAAGVILVLTGLAAGAGILSGAQLAGSVENSVIKRIESTPPKFPIDAALAGALTLKKLAPIVTNLASPPDAWVRIEASLVLDRKAAATAEPMLGAITEDMLAFLRSVTARQIEGAAGLKNLREDLVERVAIRSKGLVRDVVIETLVVQ
jgi:flagellar FliL protein